MERTRNAGSLEPKLRDALARASQPWFVTKPNWRFTAVLFADLLLIFIVLPLFPQHDTPRVIPPLLALATADATIVLLSDRRSVRVGAFVVLGLAAVSLALPHRFSHLTTSGFGAASSALITVVVGRAIFERGQVDAHRIAGAVALYLNLGLSFAATYSLINEISPEAFVGLTPDYPGHMGDMIHFSLTTLTTLGYGDILPRSPAARSIADLEAVIGQIFPATLLARLVGLNISSR